MEYKMITSLEEWNKYFLDFADLYKLCFHQPMDEEEVKWRYFKNPYKDVIACFALDKGHLVANYSVSPVYLYHDGNIIQAAQSLNTMTHPDYCGKGLFVALANRVYQHLADKGYHLVWGFPNHISNRTFITRLNWKDISTIPTLEIHLDHLPPQTKSEIVIQDDKISLDYTPCFQNHMEIQVFKSNEYLKWRYAEHPHIHYKVFSCSSDGITASSRIICKEYRDKLNIVDYSFSNAAEMQSLLEHILSYAQDQKKSDLTLWCKLGSDMHLALEKYGARNVAPITYFGNVIFDTALSSAFRDSRNWLIHMSDDNVY